MSDPLPPGWGKHSLPFPFFGHRTLAEVELTRQLQARRNLTAAEKTRLSMLLWKAERNNPPPADPEKA